MVAAGDSRRDAAGLISSAREFTGGRSSHATREGARCSVWACSLTGLSPNEIPRSPMTIPRPGSGFSDSRIMFSPVSTPLGLQEDDSPAILGRLRGGALSQHFDVHVVIAIVVYAGWGMHGRGFGTVFELVFRSIPPSCETIVSERPRLKP